MQSDPRNPTEGEQTYHYTLPQTPSANHIQQQVMLVGSPHHGQVAHNYAKAPNDGLIIATWILSACSVIISPLFCGLPAIICAIIAVAQNHPKGIQALVVSIVFPIIGLIVGVVAIGILFDGV